MHFTSQTTTDGVTERHFTLDDVPGVLWTPQDGTAPSPPAALSPPVAPSPPATPSPPAAPSQPAAPSPLVVLGHGGGRHKTAPEIVERARRFVTGAGFAVLALDVPGHGDRPTNEYYHRIATENGARIAAGEPPAPLIAEFQALVARQTVPEWRAALHAVQDHLGPAPVGYWGMSLGCGLGVPFVAAEPRVRAAVLGLGGAYANAADAARITVPVQFVVQWDDERVPRDQGFALFDALGSAEKTLHAHPGGHGDLPGFEIDDALSFLARHVAAE